jgi:TonB-linked SusC/RagA family outer membrane protein
MKRICLLFAMLAVVGTKAIAQDDKDRDENSHTITGKVVDEHGKPFEGARVSIKGTQIGAITDANGDFILEGHDGKNVIVITAIGYNTTSYYDDGESELINLEPVSMYLDGNVTTALDFEKMKRQIGYNANKVNSEDLMAGNNTSAISALQGKVPANIISSTGGPGGSSRIVFRGEKSLLQNNNALIVVDGVITNNYDRTLPNQLAQVDFGNSANDINPEEIESITTLPGGAAAALYGAAASSGAIMITTKKGSHKEAGKSSKVDVTFKSTYTQSDVLKLPEMQHTYGQGNIYTGIPDDRREYSSWGLPFDGEQRPWGQMIYGKQLVKPYSDQPYNMRTFFDHGKNFNNFVSLSGGSEKTSYYASLSSLNSNGVVPNTFYNRYSIRFNGTTQLTHNLYSTINVNYLNTYSRAEMTGSGAGSVLNSLYNTPRDIPVQELKNYDDPFYAMQFYDTSGTERYGQYNASFKNPYWTAKNYDNRNKTDRIIGDLKMGYKWCSWHIFDRIGVDAAADRSYYKSPQFDAQPIDPFYAGMNFVSPGGYTQTNRNVNSIYNDFIINFNHSLGENFGINTFVGHNITIQNDESLTTTIDPATGGLVVPNFYNFQNNAGPITAMNNRTDRRTVGLYADVNLNYRNELFLELTGRNDWSSTLSADRRSYFYPGANLSWVFTERLCGTNFKNYGLNYGKVRVAAAGVSKDGVPYANNQAGFVQTGFNSTHGTVMAPFNGVPVYQIQNYFGDNNLRPERTRDYEFGTDLAFLRNRITASFTYYSSITYGMVALVNVPASTGFLYNYRNIGDITNRGVEVSLRGTPVNTRFGLRWELFASYYHNKSMVRSLNDSGENIVLGGYNDMQIVAAAGMPYGTFYAADIQYWKDPRNGWHPIVDATTGLPVATTDKVYRGSIQPKFIASWGTDLYYKGIRLHMLFMTKQGGQFFSRTKLLLDANGNSEETTVDNRNPYIWKNSVNLVPNTNIYQENTTKFSPYAYYSGYQAQYLPAQGLVDASYVRLQELSLSYEIPHCYYEKSPFGSLEAGVFGNNLFLWTAQSNKYEDPEMTSAGALGNGQGFNYTARPSLRNYGVYIKVKF